MRILVVDDDQIVLAGCKRVLEESGHEVALTASVSEGLSALQQEEFDLLLVDVIMPEHDGMYLMNLVKRSHPGLPMLVMSGYPTPEIVANGFDMGATHFLPKPFTPDELLDAIRFVEERTRPKTED